MALIADLGSVRIEAEYASGVLKHKKKAGPLVFLRCERSRTCDRRGSVYEWALVWFNADQLLESIW